MIRELTNSEVAMELTKALIIGKPELFFDDLNDTIPRTAKVYRAMEEALEKPNKTTYDLSPDKGE